MFCEMVTGYLYIFLCNLWFPQGAKVIYVCFIAIENAIVKKQQHLIRTRQFSNDSFFFYNNVYSFQMEQSIGSMISELYNITADDNEFIFVYANW